MTGARLTIEVDGLAAVRRSLGKLIAAGHDAPPLMRAVGEGLLNPHLGGILERFDGRGVTGRNVRFVIKSRHSKDIKAYSELPGEDEVLLRAGTNMRVRKKPKERDGMLHVYVEEIDDGEV